MDQQLRVSVDGAIRLLEVVGTYAALHTSAEADQKPLPAIPADLALAGTVAEELETLMRQRGDRHTMTVSAFKNLLVDQLDGDMVEFCGPLSINGESVRLEE